MIKVLLILIISLPCLAQVSLFPEDGSQQIKKWYYSENEIRFLYPSGGWQAVESSFKKVGVTPVNTHIGSFFQDLALFDREGRLVIQHLPSSDGVTSFEYERFFQGFTMEIFMPADYPSGDPEINFLTEESVSSLNIPTKRLATSFIEGGASISGKFKNGESYLITNHSTFLGMFKYLKSLYGADFSEKDAISTIEDDFNLQPGNYIVLRGTSSKHLDTFMKALPDGLILLDNPQKRMDILSKLDDQNAVADYRTFEQSSNYRHKRKNYNNIINNAFEELKKHFTVIQVPGTFQKEKTNSNGYTGNIMDINFFNGVSGEFQGKKFYITNNARELPELEEWWKEKLLALGFSGSLIMFPGHYKGNAGLDCMGSPSP